MRWSTSHRRSSGVRSPARRRSPRCGTESQSDPAFFFGVLFVEALGFGVEGARFGLRRYQAKRRWQVGFLLCLLDGGAGLSSAASRNADEAAKPRQKQRKKPRRSDERRNSIKITDVRAASSSQIKPSVANQGANTLRTPTSLTQPTAHLPVAHATWRQVGRSAASPFRAISPFANHNRVCFGVQVVRPRHIRLRLFASPVAFAEGEHASIEPGANSRRRPLRSLSVGLRVSTRRKTRRASVIDRLRGESPGW